jgi:quercetin dioxygenase-like cupin family protein
MKSLPHLLARLLIAVLALMVAAGTAWAQDPVKVAPKNFKVLVDNDRVRVLDFHSKAGEKIGMHSHPDCVIYRFTAGKTKYTLPDGKTTEREGKAGDVTWRAAETHATEYVGTGEAHALLIELKAAAAKKEKPPQKKPAKK